MKVSPEDYVLVAGVVFGGAAGQVALLTSKHHALDVLRVAASEVTRQGLVTSPAHASMAALIGLWVLTYTAGFLSGNYSQVDKLWSLTPTMFAWIYAVGAPENSRLTLMAFVCSIWSVRLTLNFNRRGGYGWPPWTGEEDYRWKHVQAFLNASKHPLLWEAFHLGFIVIYQNLLLFLIVLPSHFVWVSYKYDGMNEPLSSMDFLLAFAIVTLVAVEGLTDEEQYKFQEVKYAMIRKGTPVENMPEPYNVGFLTSGFFAYSRHMNYFCEQSIWLVLNGFIYTAGHAELVTPALGGAFLLSILFQGSIWLQEQTTAGKYPLYRSYQKQVPQLLPFGSGFVRDVEE